MQQDISTGTLEKLKSKHEPVLELFRIGCCARCVLTFLGVDNVQDYTQAPQTLLGVSPEYTTDGVCITCLGILQSPYLDVAPKATAALATASPTALATASPAVPSPPEPSSSTESTDTVPSTAETAAPKPLEPAGVVSNILHLLKTHDYAISDFSLTLQFPSSILLRRHSAWTHIQGKFARPLGYYQDLNLLKEVTKQLIGDAMLSTLPGVPSKNDSPFRIMLSWEAANNPKEEQLIKCVYDKCINKPARKKQKMQLMSQSTVQKALGHLTAADLETYDCLPPKAGPVAQRSIELSMDSWLVGGRYVKLSRTLSQTPWEIEGERKGDTSTAEEVVRTMLDHFKATDYKFHSSGREDVDVRMLGSGRPFVVEFLEPHRTPSGPGFYSALEASVNGGSSIVRVNHLSHWSKQKFESMKNEVDQKQKTYRCVVWTSAPQTSASLAKLDQISALQVAQQTPIRVLHRRSQMTRAKTIHSAITKRLSPHFFRLDLTTSSGTYIKEFVHSDRGRTTPSVGSMLGCEADILQLDVLELHDGH